MKIFIAVQLIANVIVCSNYLDISDLYHWSVI